MDILEKLDLYITEATAPKSNPVYKKITKFVVDYYKVVSKAAAKVMPKAEKWRSDKSTVIRGLKAECGLYSPSRLKKMIAHADKMPVIIPILLSTFPVPCTIDVSYYKYEVRDLFGCPCFILSDFEGSANEVATRMSTEIKAKVNCIQALNDNTIRIIINSTFLVKGLPDFPSTSMASPDHFLAFANRVLDETIEIPEPLGLVSV